MTRLTYRIYTVVALLGLLVPLLASAAPSNQPKPPRQIAQDTVETLLNAMEGRRDELRQNPQQLHALINRVLVPLIDLDYMSQLVLGRYWRMATPEQRQRFIQAFKNMLIETYGSALLGFDDQKIKYLPIRASEGADNITFRAVIITKSGSEVPVSLDMHLVNGQWKVYDGRVGNLSFVTNYRGQFSSYIQSHSLESLIQAMGKRYGSG